MLSIEIMKKMIEKQLNFMGRFLFTTIFKTNKPTGEKK
jgi:hypothetical protein